VATFVGEVFGGPDDFSRQHGGHAGMITKHLDLKGTWLPIFVFGVKIF
jgi:hypothetical protein